MANESDFSLNPGDSLGEYRILGHIGAGGMGDVYQGLEEKLNRHVAIKVLTPELAKDISALKRFKAEGQTLGMVNHRNIVTIYQSGEDNGIHYIAMEFVEGLGMETVCENLNLKDNDACELFIQMLEGLDALHVNNIIHRDLKPHNMVFRDDNTIKIVDFGIAKVYGEESLTKTTTGVIVGTVKYMSPETAGGKAVTSRSDIWSLGAIFYEILTGRTMINADNSLEAFEQINRDEHVFPEEASAWVAPELQAIVKKMTYKDLEKRYTSTKQVIADLKAFMAKRPSGNAWKFEALGKNISNISSIKSQLKSKGYSNTQVKRIVGEAFESAKFEIAETDSDATVAMETSNTCVIDANALVKAIENFELQKKQIARKKFIKKVLSKGVPAAMVCGLIGAGWFYQDQLLSMTPLGEVAQQVHSADGQVDPSADTGKVPASAEPTAEQIAQAEARREEEARKAEEQKQIQLALEQERKRNEALQQQIALENEKKALEEQNRLEKEQKLAAEKEMVAKIILDTAGNTSLFEYKLKPSVFSGNRSPASLQEDLLNHPSIKWSNENGIDRYLLQIAQDKDFKQIVQLRNLNRPGFTWKNAPPGTYYWRVRGMSKNGFESLYTRPQKLKVDMPAPTLSQIKGPNLVFNDYSSLKSSNKKYKIAWQQMPLVSGYQVLVANDAKFQKIAADLKTSENSVEMNNTKSEIIYFKVRALDSQGRSISSYSKPQKTKLLRKLNISAPKLTAPANGTTVFSANGKIPILATWSELNQVDHYIVQISKSKSFKKSIEMKSKMSRLAIKKRLKSGLYYWRVRGIKNRYQGRWSPAATFNIK